MQEELITFKTAKLAKEKGFPQDLFDYEKALECGLQEALKLIPDKQ